ncbi:hypothetical protein TrVFT333_001800 [Trichoderma virens FT-333]|nr:hypothetical protein TrVFT333_001800 [Trichoderma virens FT-333]
MKFQPQEIPLGSPPFFQDEANRTWVPLYSHPCSFGPDIFVDKMMNLIKNPNLNSSWLFRADILYDQAKTTSNTNSISSSSATADATTSSNTNVVDADADANAHANANLTAAAEGEAPEHHETQPPSRHESDARPIAVEIRGMTLERTLVRRLIPRNERRDKPLEQTCSFFTTKRPQDGDDINSAAPASGSESGSGSGSEPRSPSPSTLVIYMPHSSSAGSLPFYHPKVQGIAHLHQWDESGKGTISIHFLPYPEHPLSDARLQRTAYHLLEIIDKHGHGVAEGYVKRVNHDLVIPQDRFQNRYALLKSKYARQLVDSWAEKTDPSKHVFEDLGIAAFLIELWSDMYPKETAAFPGFVDIGCGNGLLVYLLTQEGYSGWGFDARERKSWAQYRTGGQASPLARLWRSDCCSQPSSQEADKTKAKSTYASLVDWVSRIAQDCGWKVETEMLRIPSTRNTCLLGRTRTREVPEADVEALIAKYGGTGGYYENVAKLIKSGPRGH